jgi:hypothetical protein
MFIFVGSPTDDIFLQFLRNVLDDDVVFETGLCVQFQHDGASPQFIHAGKMDL